VPKKGCSPREDTHSLGRAWGLAYCQAQSRLCLASATLNVLGAWQHVRQANVRSNTLSLDELVYLKIYTSKFF